MTSKQTQTIKRCSHSSWLGWLDVVGFFFAAEFLIINVMLMGTLLNMVNKMNKMNNFQNTNSLISHTLTFLIKFLFYNLTFEKFLAHV